MLALAALVSVGASVSVHRYLGLCAIAAGGAGVNYFLMDPVYSFRVSQISDIAALSFYGVVGMFVTLHQTSQAGAFTFRRYQPHRRSPTRDGATLLDKYHFDLLVQLCVEIGKMSGTSVDFRDVLNVALRRLGEKVDSGGAREILEDVRLQLEYEEWAVSKLSGEEDESSKDRF